MFQSMCFTTFSPPITTSLLVESCTNSYSMWACKNTLSNSSVTGISSVVSFPQPLKQVLSSAFLHEDKTTTDSNNKPIVLISSACILMYNQFHIPHSLLSPNV